MKKLIFSCLLMFSLSTIMPMKAVNFSTIKTGALIIAKSVATLTTGVTTTSILAPITVDFVTAAMNSNVLLRIPFTKRTIRAVVPCGICALFSGYLTYKSGQLTCKLLKSLIQDALRATAPSNMTIIFH